MNFNFFSNRITDQGFETIFNVLQSGRAPANLQINMQEMDLNDDDGLEFVKAIQTGNLPTGLNLILSENAHITDKTVFNIANAIMSAQCLPKN